VIKSRIKISGEKKAPPNRKLLVWIFVLTGVSSLFLWWRGKVIRGGTSENNDPDMNFVIRREISPTPKANNEKKIKEITGELTEVIATASGRYAVYAYHMEEKWGYGFNETEQKPAASLMKLPVMATAIDKLEKEEIKLDSKYTLEDADRSTGSGPLQFKNAGTVYTLDELLGFLGKNSDNTAWVLFNRRWGKGTIQKTIDNLGMKGSNYETLMTTAADTAKIWDYLYNGKYSTAIKQAMERYLSDSIYEDRIPVGLAGTEGEVLMHKVGTDTDVWADAGVIKCKIENERCKIKPFVLVILNEGVKRTEATIIVPKLVKLIWDFENTL